MPSEEHGAWTPLPVSANPVQLRRPDPELPIFFMHIPRTGGFTLKHLLEGVYGSRHTLLDLHKYDTKKIDPAAYKVIEGHVGFKKARSMAGAPNTVTIVREPIARTISVARHLRLYGSDEHFGPLKSGTVDPRAIFEAIPDLSNAQVKQLANRLPRASADPQHLLWACAVLDSVTFGLTEQFPISMALMAERFGLRLPRFGVSNASPADGDADLRSDEFREVAAEYNQLDLQLYDHARSVFQTRQTHYVDALRSMSLQPGQLSGVFGGAPVDLGCHQPPAAPDGGAPARVVARRRSTGRCGARRRWGGLGPPPGAAG